MSSFSGPFGLVDPLTATSYVPGVGGPPKTYTIYDEAGDSGLKRWGGWVQEEFLTELQGSRGVKVYREMSENDAIVNAMLYAIKTLCRRATWRVAPASSSLEDRMWADFICECMRDMAHTWESFILELLTEFEFGWAYMEKVYKIRGGDVRDPAFKSKYSDGRIGWRKLPLRAQESFYAWDLDERGGIHGLYQLAYPRFEKLYIPIEKAILFRTTTNKNNPEGRSLLRGAYRCFSADTELLTQNGWRFASEIGSDDVLATLSDTGNLEYQTPTALWDYPYTGEMIWAHSRFVDQLVTPNHRMWVKRAGAKQFEYIEAAQCPPSTSFTSTALWNAPDIDTIQVGEQLVATDTWMEFLGFWLSEGSAWAAKAESSNSSRREITLCQKEGETAQRIRDVIKNLPWSSYERTDSRGMVRWSFTRRELFDHLVNYAGKGAYGKRIPQYALTASARQLSLLLNAYWLGDGSVIGGGVYNNATYSGTRVIFTVSNALADTLMEAMLKTGYRPNKRWVSNSGYGKGVWTLVFGKPFVQMRAKWDRVAYDGSVYCVTVPNGRVYSRRNGKCSWSGNSWFFKKQIEVFEAIGIERDLVGVPYAEIPANYTSADATDSEKAVYAGFKKLVTQLRKDEQAGFVMPQAWNAQGNPMFKVGLLQSGGEKQIDTNVVLTRLDQRIAQTLLADLILIGHIQVGSYALMDKKVGLFSRALDGFLDDVAAVMNLHLIPETIRLNGGQPRNYPKFEHSAVEEVSLRDLADYVNRLVGATILTPGPELEDHMRDVARLPSKMPVLQAQPDILQPDFTGSSGSFAGAPIS